MRFGSVRPTYRGRHRRAIGSPGWWLSVWVVAALGVGDSAAAERTTRPAAATFTESIQAVEVQVPVTVVGRDGLPIRTLAPEDFQIFDEGRRQEIESLQMIDLDALEPGWTRSQIEAAVPAAARRYVLLLFDLSFSQPAAVVRAREAARRFVVEALHPTDLAAVAVLTAEAGPRLVVTFSPDRAQLARAIDAVGAPELLHLTPGRDPLRFLIETPAASSGIVASREAPVGDENFRSSNPEVQGYLDVIGQRMSSVERSFDRGRVEGWTHAMAGLARSLDSLRGRKYVVYLSEGFDSQLLYGQPLGSSSSGAGGELTALERNQQGTLDTEEIYGSSQLQSAMERMLQEFRRADCVIEAIDISGFGTSAGKRRRSLDAKGSLSYLARETGGEMYVGANKLGEQLEVMLRRTAVTYLLSFRPSRLEQDGRYHRLKVKAQVPAQARLTHRAGYYAPRPFGDLHAFEKELLIADAVAAATPTTEVDFDVLAAPFRAGGERTYVPVVIEVAGESLIVGHEGDHLPIEIYTYVTDEEGRIADFFTHVLTFNLAGRRAVFQRTGLKYYGHLDLREGRDYLLRVVVRNGQTGRTGVETVSLDVPDYSDHRPVLLQPFFVEAEPQWFMVREQPPAELAEEWIVYPFTLKGDPFIPSVRPVLRDGQEIKLCLIAYNLGVEDIQLEGRVRAAVGNEVGGGRIELKEHIVASSDGVDKLVVAFRPEDLAPGDYRLQLSLTDPSWGEAALQEVAFEIAD